MATPEQRLKSKLLQTKLLVSIKPTFTDFFLTGLITPARFLRIPILCNFRILFLVPSYKILQEASNRATTAPR